MRRTIILVISIFSLSLTTLHAQEGESLLNNTWSIGGGSMKLYDSYLSPVTYSGFDITLDATTGLLYKKSNQQVSWESRLQLCFGDLYNPAKTASITYFGASIGYASHYHFRPTTGLTIMTGGFLNVEGALKYNSRNVNNIASGDLNATLYASVIARYNVRKNSFHMNAQYELMTPIMGFMFIPQMGHSYYEIYENLPNDLSKITHFSSFHNKQGIQGKFTLDFLLRNVTLRTGFTHNNLTWQGNSLNFKQSQLNFIIGMMYDIHLFGGKKAEKHATIWQ